MNLINRMMISDLSNEKLNIDGSKKYCDCKDCVSIKNDYISNDFFIKFENYYLMCKEKKNLNILNLEYWYKDKKTKTFIWKALQVHGNKYDYHNTIYIKSSEYVCIKCPYGHDFSQTPSNHIHGYNCNICSGTKKLTLEEFIERAKIEHGDLYDYSKVVYKNMTTEVIIICKTCENNNRPCEFKQTPRKHLNGQGCPICRYIKSAEKLKLTLEEFIKKARKVHGDKYDYSKVNYVNMSTEVIIICPKHGEFPQTPNHHIYCKAGCPACKESKGAKKIKFFLVNNNIRFEQEKRFSDCKNIRPLPFDFYIPQYNICIEFDGEQHFNPSAFNSRKIDEKIKLENLKLIQFRDNLKNEYCKNKGINLLRIKYNENVKNKLIEFLKNKINLILQ